MLSEWNLFSTLIFGVCLLNEEYGYMNTPAEFIKKRYVRKTFSHASLEDLTKITRNFEELTEEKKEALRAAEEQNKARQESVRYVLQVMQERDVSIDDLGRNRVKSGSGGKRKIQRYKFAFHGEDGTSDSWEGPLVGQMPRRLRTYLKRTGKKRSDCIEHPL